MPEIIIVSDAVEGTLEDLDGESRHEQVEAKLSRRGRKVLDEDEEKRSPIKKIREESRKEYGAGRGRKEDLRTERGERSAEAPVSLIDHAAKKTLSYWQLASVVVCECDESFTNNLCQMCFNKHLQAKGEEPLTNVKWRQVVEKKAFVEEECGE